MIKTIVFDLDNTLLEWKKEYIYAIKKVNDDLNLELDNLKLKQIDNLLSLYEKENVYFKEKKLLDYINNCCNLNLPLKFIKMLLQEQKNCYEQYTSEQLDTLKYLSKKYELLVITNWFSETQRCRLENVGILKYFKVVSGGDEHELKPSLNAFKIINNPKESIMIGDNIKNDIEPALKLGMQAILITNKTTRKDLRYKKISKLEQLKEML